MGALEAEVLGVLWKLREPATPSDVLAALNTDLAYTTIMTTLTRLWEKELVTRQRRGKAYVYVAARSEAELTAERMHRTLAATGNRRAALLKFVDTLSRSETRALRDLLGDEAKRPK